MNNFRAWVIAALLVLCAGVCLVPSTVFGVITYRNAHPTAEPTRASPPNFRSIAIHAFESAMKRLGCDYQYDKIEVMESNPDNSTTLLPYIVRVNILYWVRSSPAEQYTHDEASYEFENGVPLSGQDPINCK